MVQQIKDLPCIRFIITVDHYCFVCLFGALVFVSRILANLCVFFVCWMKFPSDLAMISSLSVINIWVWPALSLRGRPRGAGPLPGTLKVRLAKEGGLTFLFYFSQQFQPQNYAFAIAWSKVCILVIFSCFQ